MRLSVDIKQKLGAFDLDVAFDTPDGITVLFGRSGSGKTSIVRSVAGLLKPASGRISAGSKVLFDAETDTFVPPHKRRIGYVFQEDRLFPHLSVAQNLEYGTRFHNSKTADKTRNEIVAMLGLEALLSRRPAGLSGGEKQRVAIGRALMSDPMLLLADEPLAALDDARKDEILPYFERLRDHLKVPMLYVTHSAAEVSRLATTVVALDKGRVIKQGPAVSILSDPQITPLGAGAAGAFLRAVVKRHFDDGITEVDAMGTSLLVPGITNPVGTQLRIRVEAQDVMIALEHPKDISALNVLPAIISEVRQGDGPGALVQLKLGENVLLARITRRSADALALKDGKPVYAIIKAVSIPRDAIGEGHDPTEN